MAFRCPKCSDVIYSTEDLAMGGPLDHYPVCAQCGEYYSDNTWNWIDDDYYPEQQWSNSG